MKVYLLIFTFLLPFISLSQEASIEGSVKDKKGPIPGIKVHLLETKFRAITDIDGKYTFINVPIGNYILEFEGEGYNSFQLNVALSPNEKKQLASIELKESRALNEVTFSYQTKTSEQKAFNITKNSPLVLNVVSADVIAKLPNKNASDVVARVPGASLTRNKGEGSNISLRGTPMDWTATFLNGDRLPVADEENTSRSFEFEVLPSDIIEYVFVAKTTTPDMETDQIGGSINFITKTALKEKTVKLNVAGGYNTLAQKPIGTFNFTYGNCSKNKKWSYIFNTSNYARYYAADAFKLVYGSNFNHSLNRYELKKYNGTRINTGSYGAIEFKPNDHFKIGTHFLYSFMQDDKYQKKQSYNWYEGSGQRIRLQNIHGKLDRQLFGGDIYSEWKISPKLNLNAKISSFDNQFWYGNVPYTKNDGRNGYLVSEFISPLLHFTDEDFVSLYGEPIDPNDPNAFPAKLIGQDNPYGNGDNPTNIQPQFVTIFGGKPLEAKDFEYYQSYTEINHTREKDAIVAQAELQFKPTQNLKLKIGSKFRYKTGYRHLSKHEWFKDYSIPGNNQPFMLTDFKQENFNGNQSGFLSAYGANYDNQFFPFIDHTTLSSFLSDSSYLLREKEMNKINQEYYQWVGSNYEYKEWQSGTFIMADYTVKKWSFVGGFRLENTKLYEVSDTLTATLAFDTLTGNQYNVPERRSIQRNYMFLLPSLNITFKINDKQNLRACFSESMKRPNFEQTKPGFAMIKYTDLTYIFGNPNLKPTFAYNFDLFYEFFWQGKGMFSIGAFYKNIYNHIFTVTTADIDPASGIMVKKYENASTSLVYGLEMTIIRKFDFLPGILKGLGTNSNITISDSKMNIPGRPQAQKMTEQTPLIFNAGLTYEYKKWSARIAYNYIGKHLKEVNLSSLVGIGLLHKDNDFDTYVNKSWNLDVQCSYAIKPHINFYLEGMNLLNSPMRTFIGKEWRSLRTEYYGLRFQIGVRFDL